MGAAAPILGGALLGIGVSAMSKKPALGMPTQVHSTMAVQQPQTPEAPVSTDGTDNGNQLMEAERERERQQAAWRKRQAQEVFTSGLGAAGLADTAKKTLLGG